MKKRAISQVVSISLIVLSIIVAVLILWLGILPLIKNLGSAYPRVDLTIDTSSGYTFWDEEKRIACVDVKRGNDDAELAGIQFIFSVKGESETYNVLNELDEISENCNKENYTPKLNQGKALSFFFLGLDFGTPEYVAVAPIFKIGEKKKIGRITSKVKLPKGELADVPNVLFYKYWCDGYDDDKNCNLDLPNEGFGLLEHWGSSSCNVDNNYCNGADVIGGSEVVETGGKPDGIVDIRDVGVFAWWWSCSVKNNWCDGNDTNKDGIAECSSGNNWCDGTDVNQDGRVDAYDLGTRGPYLERAICIP